MRLVTITVAGVTEAQAAAAISGYDGWVVSVTVLRAAGPAVAGVQVSILLSRGEWPTLRSRLVTFMGARGVLDDALVTWQVHADTVELFDASDRGRRVGNVHRLKPDGSED